MGHYNNSSVLLRRGGVLSVIIVLTAEIQDEEEKRTQIQCLVEQLPAVNRETLKRLIGHLKKYEI